MLGDLAVWKQVANDHTLLERAASVDASDVAAVASLRKSASAEAVAVALQLAAARAKAVEKFGERGRSLVADVAGVEQASGGAVAAYKAKRIRYSLGGAGRIADLCCGIGGDSMAMVGQGLDVLPVDREPLRVWMTESNTHHLAKALCADVEQLRMVGKAIHIDPARRDESAGRRSWRLEDYQPGPDVIGGLIDAAPAAAVKLSPGVDVEALPRPGEVEFISDRGRLVQCVLWAGAFAQGKRRATRLDGDEVRVLSGEPHGVPIGDIDRYLYTFDPAVERAELIGQLCDAVDAPAVHPKLGLLTSDRVIDSPWLTGFAFIERLPWRPKRVKQWLAAHDGGLVEVKTRGKACDPDREQQRLRGDGATGYTVFVLRFETKVQALITTRA
ncbi:MAG: THUMP-like domain-containing protein [Phycisphaeraceae bacterium]